jgi:hypothetical protein
MDQSS